MQSLGTKKPGTPGFLLVIGKDHSVTSKRQRQIGLLQSPYRHSAVVTQYEGGPNLPCAVECPEFRAFQVLVGVRHTVD